MEMTSIHKDSAQESAYMDEEKITVKTLDQIYNDLIVDGDKVLLKIDVQGKTKTQKLVIRQ